MILLWGGGIWIKTDTTTLWIKLYWVPVESILHLQRREGIVGSLKVGAWICLRWVSKHQIPYNLDAYGFRQSDEHIAMGYICLECCTCENLRDTTAGTVWWSKRYVEFILVIGNRTNTKKCQERRKWKNNFKEILRKVINCVKELHCIYTRYPSNTSLLS